MSWLTEAWDKVETEVKRPFKQFEAEWNRSDLFRAGVLAPAAIIAAPAALPVLGSAAAGAGEVAGGIAKAAAGLTGVVGNVIKAVPGAIETLANVIPQVGSVIGDVQEIIGPGDEPGSPEPSIPVPDQPWWELFPKEPTPSPVPSPVPEPVILTTPAAAGPSYMPLILIAAAAYFLLR